MGGFSWRDILMDTSGSGSNNDGRSSTPPSNRNSSSSTATMSKYSSKRQGTGKLTAIDLPPELLAKIFGFLPGRDVGSASRACRAFYEASKIEEIWRRRCANEYGISLRDNEKELSYMQLYTKILHKYGHMIGLWQTEVASYGGLLQVKFEDSRLVGIEWHPPSNPNLREALRRQNLFTIELMPDGQVQILCQKGSRGPHPASIEMKRKIVFYSKCCCPEKHEYEGSKDQEFFEWLKDETIFTHLLDVHMKELYLMKFLMIRQYERNAFEHRRLRPSPHTPDAIIQPGLFKGTYSAHGLELILLTYEAYGTKVKATKITGDPNVPAGQLTFKSDLRYPVILTEMQQLDAREMKQPDAVASPIPIDRLPLQPFRVPEEYWSREELVSVPNTCKARFYGYGQIAGHGFINPSFSGGHWIVFNEDLFGFMWFELLSLSLYHRVQEDIISET